MAARKVAVNVVVVDDAANPVLLEAGSDVPDWAVDQVGDHCLEKPASKAPAKSAAK